MKVKNYFDTEDDRPGRKPASGTVKSGVKKSEGRPGREARSGEVQGSGVKINAARSGVNKDAAVKTNAKAPAHQRNDAAVRKSQAPDDGGLNNALQTEGIRKASKSGETVRQEAARPMRAKREDMLSEEIQASAVPVEAEETQAAESAAVAVEEQVIEAVPVPVETKTAEAAPAVADTQAAEAVPAAVAVEDAEAGAAENTPEVKMERSAAGLMAAAYMGPDAAAKNADIRAGNETDKGAQAGDNRSGTESNGDWDSDDIDDEDDWSLDVDNEKRYKKARNKRGNHDGGSDETGGMKKKIPIVWVIVIDVVIAALLLLAFSLYYVILPRDMSGNETELPRPTQTAVATPAPTESLPAEPVATEEPEPTPTPDGTAWGMNFPGVFTDGEVLQDETSYKSGNISVSIEHKELNKVSYYVADVYIKDYQYFRTAFGNENTFGYIDRTKDILEYVGGIIGVNGDFCTKNEGVVVRNGVMQRDKMHDSDLLVLNYDGTMQTFSPEEFDLEKIEAEGVWQVWTFGPMLLKDGQPMTEFNTTSRIAAANPRTAVGYFEPGHYCFVVADGRSPQPTDGFTLAEMSQILYDMGCKVAYNMDGGKTSEMVFLGKTVNEPYEGGRQTSDILYIADDKGGY